MVGATVGETSKDPAWRDLIFRGRGRNRRSSSEEMTFQSVVSSGKRINQEGISVAGGLWRGWSGDPLGNEMWAET